MFLELPVSNSCSSRQSFYQVIISDQIYTAFSRLLMIMLMLLLLLLVFHDQRLLLLWKLYVTPNFILSFCGRHHLDLLTVPWAAWYPAVSLVIIMILLHSHRERIWSKVVGCACNLQVVTTVLRCQRIWVPLQHLSQSIGGWGRQDAIAWESQEAMAVACSYWTAWLVRRVVLKGFGRGWLRRQADESSRYFH